jgi:hypothetical protein
MQLSQQVSIIEQIKNKEVDLPKNYQKAVLALEECNSLDEIKDYSDKMTALALYYKQANDSVLENLATRIKHRAKRRMGELLKQFDGRGLYTEGNQYTGQNGKNDVNVNSPNSINYIGSSIGLTERQKTEAIRLANIPEQKFEELIESDKVPTASQLADIGTKKRVKEVPKNFINNVQFGLLLNDMLSFMEKFDALYILNEMDEKTKENYKNKIDKIENWFDNFIVNL